MDRFNNLFVTAYVTPGNARFLLLHDGKNDDSIRSFFSEVYELYLRVSHHQAAVGEGGGGKGRHTKASVWHARMSMHQAAVKRPPSCVSQRVLTKARNVNAPLLPLIHLMVNAGDAQPLSYLVHAHHLQDV